MMIVERTSDPTAGCPARPGPGPGILGAKRVLRELDASFRRASPSGFPLQAGHDGRDAWLTSGLMYFVAAADPRRGLAGHARTAAAYAGLLARALGIGQDRFLLDLERGALLHDIGKTVVPDAILEKAGPLGFFEREILREHPVVGFRMIEEFAFLRGAAEVVLCHHERFDGRGYPAGLAGERIPLGARVLAVADALDAMTADRVYRRRRPLEEAVSEIARCGGRQFDPAVVAAFLDVPAGEWRRAARGAAWLVRPPSVH